MTTIQRSVFVGVNAVHKLIRKISSHCTLELRTSERAMQNLWIQFNLVECILGDCVLPQIVELKVDFSIMVCPFIDLLEAAKRDHDANNICIGQICALCQITKQISKHLIYLKKFEGEHANQEPVIFRSMGYRSKISKLEAICWNQRWVSFGHDSLVLEEYPNFGVTWSELNPSICKHSETLYNVYFHLVNLRLELGDMEGIDGCLHSSSLVISHSEIHCGGRQDMKFAL